MQQRPCSPNLLDALHVRAVRLVLAGKGVLILARRPEMDVTTGLLHALDLVTATPEASGQRCL